MKHRPLQEGDPVGFTGTHQDVRRRHGDPILGILWLQRREQLHVPQLSYLADISTRAMAQKLLVGHQFLQENVRAFRVDVLVNPHSGVIQLLGRIKLVGVHPDHVIGGDLAVG